MLSMAFLKVARASPSSLFSATDFESAVNDALGGGLLAVKQNLVDELRHEAIVVDGIRLDLAAVCCCTTRHVKSPCYCQPTAGVPAPIKLSDQISTYFLGRLAP